MKPSHRALLLGVLLSLCGTPSPGQTPVSPDSARLKIPAIFAAYDRSDAPGCVVGVFRAGTVLYTGAFGLANVAHRIPLSDTTVLSIASASKQFTAFAVLLLEADGKLRLDDDIRRHVPEVPDFGAPITLRALLSHTAGLRDYWNLFDMAGWRISDDETKEDLLWLVSRQRSLNHQPGAEFFYSNTGYGLLAIAVERVSGIPFRRFVSERVLRPLGMTRSDVRVVMEQVIPGMAQGYWGHAPASLYYAVPPFSFAGPTGVVSTVRDLALWDANFYAPKVGTSALLDQMRTPGRLADGTSFGYGMGLFIGSHKGHRMISHAGSDPGYKADLLRFPDDSLSVTVLCNAFDIPPTPLALQVADLYLPYLAPAATRPDSAITARDTAPPPPIQILAGLYWHSVSGSTYRFFFENDQLVLDGGGEGKFPLAPVGPGAYRLTAAPRRYILRFRREAGGLVMDEDIEGSPVRRFVRAPDAPARPAPLQPLTGAYHSPELEVTWNIVLAEGRLVLKRHRMAADSLTLLFGDVFQSRHGFMLEFTRARRGAPASLTVSTERIRRLRFTRDDAGRLNSRSGSGAGVGPVEFGLR
jgi:CubicO group peptidase (beta-lactamase class C family)